MWRRRRNVEEECPSADLLQIFCKSCTFPRSLGEPGAASRGRKVSLTAEATTPPPVFSPRRPDYCWRAPNANNKPGA